LFVELDDGVRHWTDDDCGLIVFLDIEVFVVDIHFPGAIVVDGLVFGCLVLVWGIVKMNRQLKLEL
jgi:hypothetical protein